MLGFLGWLSSTALADPDPLAELDRALIDGRMARARWLAGDLLREDPTDPERWIRLAQATDDPREALPLLDEALRLAPADPAAIVARARLLDQIGRSSEAVAALAPLDTPAAEIALADVLGDPAPARRALASSPGDPDAALAVARWTRDPDEARAALGAVSVADRRVLAARVDRALRDGDPAGARARWDELRAIAPASPDTERLGRWVDCLGRGAVDPETLGDLLDARRTALTAPGAAVDVGALAARAPECAAAQQLRATIERDPARRIEAARAAVALAPDDPGLVEDLGQALLDASRPADARTALERARTLRPSIPPTALARAIAALGDRDGARALLDDSAPRFPDDPELALLHAELTRDRPRALAILVEALERTSDPRLLARARELADALDQADALAPVLRGPKPAPLPDDVSEEVVVVAKSSQKRLDELVSRLHELGYHGDPVTRGDGSVEFEAEGVDRPGIVLHPDGLYDVQVAGMVPVHKYPWLGDQSPMVRKSISARKLGQGRDAVIEALQPELRAWREALCAEGFEDRLVYEIPPTLDRVWRDGVGREGQALATPEQRRAELLDWWVTRTCTPEGDAVRNLIAGYLGDVVQRSQWPVTVAELDAVNARRPCEIALALPTP